MSLEQIGHWNDLSPKLREELNEKIKGFGKRVKYKFNISHDNPDPEKVNGSTIWPFIYTLDPVSFRITDPYEKREGKSSTKQIGMINELDEKGLPKSFFKFRVSERHKGVVILDLENNPHDVMECMFLELHPKLTDGMFKDKTRQPIFSRVDEAKDAKEGREKRETRLKAMDAARNMSDKEVTEFAVAMLWDESEEVPTLRNQVEDLAEKDPQVFTDLIKSKNIEYQAVIKKALDKQIIAYNPADFKFIWCSTQQAIASLGVNLQDKNHVERFAEWLQINGQKSEEIYRKIKSLVKV